MADILTDDELEKRRQLAGSIGKPIVPPSGGNPSIGAAITSPDVQPIQQQMPQTASISGMTPLSAPRPAGDRYAAMAAAGPPQYHGLKKVLDTIGGATSIGRAIEQGGGFGTQGYDAKLAQEGGAAKAEEDQIKAGEEERQANATTEGEQIKNAGDEAGQVPQTIHTAAGDLQVPTKNIQTPASAIINTTGRENVAETNQAGANQRTTDTNTSRQNIAADTNASHETIATGRNKTSQEIAADRAASAERVATGRNLATVEAAKIRAAAQNDPDKLTAVMKTMKQQAQATLPQIDRALDETEAVAGMLGPTEGRWNDFWQGKVGVSDPKFAHYKDEIGMVSTAVTLAHARGRMSNELFEHFQQMFDAGKQAPENMIQALNVAKEWLDGYAKMGDPGSPVGGGGGGNGANTPAPPTSGGSLKIIRDANGRITGIQ